MDSRKIVLLHWIGRFGNRMFQYAFGCGYAKKYGCTFYIPSEWEGTTLFAPNKYCKIIPDDKLRHTINQTLPQFDNKASRQKAMNDYNTREKDNVEYVTCGNKSTYGKTNIAFDDLDCMYFQHCYEIVDQALINEIFEFSNEVKLSKVYLQHYEKRQTYDVMHLRRGDVANPNFKGAYSMISTNSYINQMNALKINPVIVSDDQKVRTPTEWVSTGHRWSYPVGEQRQPVIFFDWFPDFLTIMFGRIVLRGNSSFSWWACRLGKVDVYSPILTPKPEPNAHYCQYAEFEHSNCPHFVGKYDRITI
jgi:hypothetical protein